MASTDNARAACTQVGSTVTCDDTTYNYNPGNQSGVTTTVTPGAFVIGTDGNDAIRLSNATATGNTLINNGYINGFVTILSAGPGVDRFINNGVFVANGILQDHSMVGSLFQQTTSGTFIARVDSNGFNDGVFALNALLGGRLSIAPQSGIYTGPSVYTVVTTLAGIGGTTFGSVGSLSPFFSVATVYGANNVNVTLTPIAFNATSGLTQNQRAVANTLQNYYGANSAALSPVATTFFSNLYAVTSLSALDQLSGEGIAAAQSASFSLGDMFTSAMSGAATFTGGNTPSSPLGYASARRNHPLDAYARSRFEDADARRWQAWFTGFAGTRSQDGDATVVGNAKSTQSGGGGVAGASYAASPNTTLGFAVGVTGARVSVEDRATTGNLTAGHLGIYATQRSGPYYMTASLSYARIGNNFRRTVAGIGPTEFTTGGFDSDLVTSRMEVGWRHAWKNYTVMPFAAFQASQLWQRGYSESSVQAGGNPGILGLDVASQSITSLPLTLGAQIDGDFRLASGKAVSPFLRAGWQHEFKPDTRFAASFASLPSTGFTVNGASRAADALMLRSGARVALGPDTALVATIDGEFSGRTASYGGTGSLRMAW
jgi:outer membrane autotransporter protein